MEFFADARDGRGHVDVCSECCCEQAEIKPGEIANVRVNYAAWVAHLRAKGLVDGATEIMVARQVVRGEGVGSDLTFTTMAPGVLTQSVALDADPVGAIYALASEPKLGVVSLTTQGDLVYTTQAGAAGVESFMVSVTANGQAHMRRVAIIVETAADFSFIAKPGRPMQSAILSPLDDAGSVYQVFAGRAGAPIKVEEALNGTLLAPTTQNMTNAGPNRLTVVETKFGRVQLRADGVFWYSPNEHVSGLDVFQISVLPPGSIVVPGTAGQGVTKTVVIELPEVFVDGDRIKVRTPMLSFPVAVQRDAKIGHAYRLTVHQAAQDCDGNRFEHVSCIDVTVGRC